MSGSIPVLSVTLLNKQVRFYLENEIGIIHVEGEISNLSKPGSGHHYFTLKDASSQIRCVFFKNRHDAETKNIVKDGQQIVAQGRLSLYEARGDYQLIIDKITEAGLGLLYQQFEALKKKLAAEGLFDIAHKKTLPQYPATIGIITSSNGAALKDILCTLARRFPLAKVMVYHSEVQGLTAPAQLIKALGRAIHDGYSDVLIIARGGGSIEDLWAFNDEKLARTIASCPIPIVSGVGHETDFTITDFVADHRAATPTAAAETVTVDWMELLSVFNGFIYRLEHLMQQYLQQLRTKLTHTYEKIASPKQIIATQSQTLDYLLERLQNQFKQNIRIKQQQLTVYLLLLNTYNPKTRIQQAKIKLSPIESNLHQSMRTILQTYQQQLRSMLATLHAVSPLATLDRGYSLATKNNTVIYSVKQIQTGDILDLRLSQGTLTCEVLSEKL